MYYDGMGFFGMSWQSSVTERRAGSTEMNPSDAAGYGCRLACFAAVAHERLDPDRIIARLHTR